MQNIQFYAHTFSVGWQKVIDLNYYYFLLHYFSLISNFTKNWRFFWKRIGFSQQPDIWYFIFIFLAQGYWSGRWVVCGFRSWNIYSSQIIVHIWRERKIKEWLNKRRTFCPSWKMLELRWYGVLKRDREFNIPFSML